jgi:xanthine dehydrogenase accessory factor
VSVGVDLAAQEAALVARRQPYVRVTVVWASAPVSAKAGDAALVTADGLLLGWVGGSCSEPVVVSQALTALSEGSPRLVRLDPPGTTSPAREGMIVAPVTCASGGSLEVFVEPRLPAPHLVIVGRSPMVQALAAMAPAIGFEVAVVERDGVDAGLFPAARVIGELDLGKVGTGPESYVVVATMGRYDEDALEQALATGARFVALVASSQRAAAVREILAASVPEADLTRIRAPAGLDLGHLPHPEIAVAILAEIVAEKARSAPMPTVAAPCEVSDVTDPVCGMTADVGSTSGPVTYDGMTYWFCSAGCRRRFEAAPERFVT